jgi:hypothetical protein
MNKGISGISYSRGRHARLVGVGPAAGNRAASSGRCGYGIGLHRRQLSPSPIARPERMGRKGPDVIGGAPPGKSQSSEQLSVPQKFGVSHCCLSHPSLQIQLFWPTHIPRPLHQSGAILPQQSNAAVSPDQVRQIRTATAVIAAKRRRLVVEGLTQRALPAGDPRAAMCFSSASCGKWEYCGTGQAVKQ